jgi:hypothetical protein
LRCFGTFVLVPQFVSTPESAGYGFGASPIVAGLYLVPASVMMLFSGPLAGVFGRRYGSKWPLALGMGLVALASLGLASRNAVPLDVIVSMVLLGAGVAAAFAAMAALITESVRPTETGVATGMNTVMRSLLRSQAVSPSSSRRRFVRGAEPRRLRRWTRAAALGDDRRQRPAHRWAGDKARRSGVVRPRRKGQDLVRLKKVSPR